MKENFDSQNDVELNNCEKLISKDSFEYFCGDIKNDYLNLTYNLDNESVEVIVRIISRIRLYWRHGASSFWLTKEEKEELLRIYDANCSNILQISDECCAYGRYLLPRKIISPTVFYYRHFLDRFEHPDRINKKNIIDVGGFIGDSCLVLSEYTNEKVHVFEPVTELHDLLLKTITLNDLKKVVVNKLALGSRHERMNINIAGDNSTLCQNDHVAQYNCRQEYVDVITLDSYVEQHNLEVGLIKVDIEGFEMEFLKGAMETIKSQKPSLLISIYHSAEDFFLIKPLIESWNLGYKFKVVKPMDKSIITDTNLVAEVG